MSKQLATTDYARMDYELDEYGRIYLHLDLKEFSLSIYRRMRRDFREVLDFLSFKGYEDVFVVIPNNDPLLRKFEETFGFELMLELEGHLIYSMEI